MNAFHSSNLAISLRCFVSTDDIASLSSYINYFLIHSDEGLKLETSDFESFTVDNLPYRPCG